MAFDVQKLNVTFGDVGADNRQIYVLRAPSASTGGGITVLAARAVSTTTLALSAGVAGTTFTLGLMRYSSAGTPAVNGTIAAAIGGTAVGWTAGVVQEFTINSTYAYLSAGEWLVLQYNEVNAGNPIWGQLDVTYVMGRTV